MFFYSFQYRQMILQYTFSNEDLQYFQIDYPLEIKFIFNIWRINYLSYSRSHDRKWNFRHFLLSRIWIDSFETLNIKLWKIFRKQS